jgi:Uncharacterized protein with SCP/PR1 domains
MKKLSKILFGTIIAISAFSNTSLAASEGWKLGSNSNSGKWWYEYADRTYPANRWEWIDGNNDGISECYYFDNNGWLLTSRSIDSYTVNSQGAWTVNGIIQTKSNFKNGWIFEGSNWKFYNVGEQYRSQWLLYNSSWYYLNAQGNMSTEFQTINGGYYYFNNNGEMQAYNFTHNNISYSTNGNGLIINQTNSHETFKLQVLELMNEERQKVGVSPLTMNNEISALAQIRAQEITNLFSHTRPNGSSFYSIIVNNNLPYSNIAENIAAGQTTPQSVMTSWMNSPGHKANILNPALKEVGIGCHYIDSGYNWYWVQLFYTSQ